MCETPLKQARMGRQMTQAEAAELVGIDQGQWSRIERGRQVPGLAVLARITSAFSISEAAVLYPCGKEAA